jgi:hypothetical protein
VKLLENIFELNSLPRLAALVGFIEEQGSTMNLRVQASVQQQKKVQRFKVQHHGRSKVYGFKDKRRFSHIEL